uniref:Protein POLLEN DEFECTIVE IN GUIDANCE 1 n=1 Tax=Ananas comosus var. bracteatus TaxID=296719 RepID=A0A6V7Q316_ANACO|nr:unnamed protein product [Ananas comosus var. bracteatus]
MPLRSSGRQISFEILAGDTSGDDGGGGGGGGDPPRRKRRARGSKKKKRPNPVAEEPSVAPPIGSEHRKPLAPDNALCEDEIGFKMLESRSVVETVCEGAVVVESSQVSSVSYVELRQRNVNGGGVGDEVGDEAAASARESSAGSWRPESNGSVTNLAKEKSLDWNQVVAEDPNILGEVSSSAKSPFAYFVGEIYGGNALRSTIAVGNEKKRQRVYNTMFTCPGDLIIAGFFVCLDSFLSLLTIMPARILMTIWRVLKTRQFQRPNAAELSDFGCLIVLALGVVSLQRIDISLIYHVIRGQGTIKLYVIYNVLEIFDKLCQSFGEDVLQVLFNSAEGLSNCSPDTFTFELMRFILDETIAAITLATCIIAHNNALLALLVSNNFAEIKSNVFKRVSKENLHNLVYYDIVERFHITAFLLFVLAQNILEAEGTWFESFLINALLVYLCEVLIDAIKHSFLAKFNEIKPIAYSEFLEDLCKQYLNEKPEERRQDLTFIPLAPACVVFRVLTPVYATLLPFGPFLWRVFWVLLWSSLTYVMLAICKILVGLSLRRLATWYVNLRLERKQHVD